MWHARGVSTPPDPGRRVTVRRRLPDGSVGDVVGRVLAGDARGLRLERRDGTVVDVAGEDVLLLREVPTRSVRPRRALDVSVDDLARITSRGWPAPESVPLGDWELRAAGAFTGRANSVAVHGDPGLPEDEAIAAVVAFYTDRGLVPRVQVEVGSRWEAALLGHGWVAQEGYRGGAIVQVADLAGPYPTDPAVVVEPTASDAWIPLYGRTDDVATARAVLEGPPTVGFARIGEGPEAIARVVVTGEWAGLAAVETHPDHRRRGLARTLVDACLAWAWERGATRAYLQTMPENLPAIALYAPYGFVTHHEYRYLVLPGS